jgi:hypothetical protein
MCVERAADLMNTDWFKNGLASLVFIGSGTVGIGKGVGLELDMFRKGAKLLVDQSFGFKVYQALGAHRSVAATFYLKRKENVKGLLYFPLQVLRGKLPYLSGNPYLQGATYVFNKHNEVCYRQIEISPGNPRVDYKSLKRAIEEDVKIGMITVRMTDHDIIASIYRRLVVMSGFSTILIAAIIAFKMRKRFFSSSS